ncbi:hypothetical protein [Nocardioides ochotonae]|uniref:hypothetical protein n=1 Tax=Nocardioides ochotonae TaxID=2685869 RepID=UPI001CD7488B|nr:hypothetical protein [Nocardioides ochotonae]
MSQQTDDGSEQTVAELMTQYTYARHRPPLAESAEVLRARIPGWGADLDPADRPSVPQEVYDPAATGAHWTFPERQPGGEGRERSIEHAFLTPVFGTAQPLRGASGLLRRVAYRRFSEARAAHWLVLMAADRVDVAEGFASSLLRARPDNLIAETGVPSERRRHGLASRLGRGRADVGHHALDPVVVAGPWVLAGAAGYRFARRVRRARR